MKSPLIIGLCLSLLAFSQFSHADIDMCTSPYKGQKLTQTQLNTLLSKHATWVKLKGHDSDKLNLCGTDLSKLNFAGADLRGVNFYGADLSNANLDKANLEGSDLQRVYLRWSSLKKANLTAANLNRASIQDANLAHANLRQTNLQNADFSSANLQYAEILGANAQMANFGDAKLMHANFNYADLSSANLESSNLSDANLSNAKLIRADLNFANLTRTNLTDADLSFALMEDTHLDKTDFTRVNLYQTLYQPKTDTLPDTISLASSKNFRDIRFHHQEGIPAMVALRAAYARNGMRSMEREVTALIKTKQMQDSWKRGGWGYVEAAFGYTFFYITSDYGAAPGKPLRIFLLFVLLYSIPYLFALIYANRKSGIVIYWQSGRFYKWDKSKQKNVSQELSLLLKKRHHRSIAGNIKETWRLFCTALYFSCLMSFQIGWRELNIGNWLSRLQTREYHLKAKGWVRMLAGSQSLLSAYLIVLWAFTYFGRPFEW